MWECDLKKKERVSKERTPAVIIELGGFRKNIGFFGTAFPSSSEHKCKLIN